MATAHAVAQSGDVGFFFFWEKATPASHQVLGAAAPVGTPPCGAVHHTNVAAGQRRHACVRPVEPLGVLFEGEDVAAGKIVGSECFGQSTWFRYIAEHNGDGCFIRLLDEACMQLSALVS